MNTISEKQIKEAATMITDLTSEHESVTREIMALHDKICALGLGSDAARPFYQDRARAVERRRIIEERLYGMLWMWGTLGQDLSALDAETILRLAQIESAVPVCVVRTLSKAVWEATATA